MARARLLKPGFFSNETLTECPPFGRLLFAGLWTIADREGRLPDRPKWIKGALFPYENVAVDKLLKQLASLGFLERYEVDGQRYIQVVNFSKHQHVHVNEQPSTIPAPYSHHANIPNVETRPAEAKAEADPEAKAFDPEAEAEADGDNPVEEARRLCRDVFGLSSPIGQRTEEAIARYGPECVGHSVKEAALSGGASWKYAEKIMQRHEAEGCDEEGSTRLERLLAR